MRFFLMKRIKAPYLSISLLLTSSKNARNMEHFVHKDGAEYSTRNFVSSAP